MTAMVVAIDEQFLIEGSLYKVLVRSKDGQIVFENVLNGTPRTWSDAAIAKLISGGMARRVPAQKASDDNSRAVFNARTADFAQFPERLKDRANRAFLYVQAFINRGLKRNQKAIKAVLLHIAEELNDMDPPHPATVCRWWRKFEQGNRDIRSLVPKHWLRGEKKRLRGVKKIIVEKGKVVYMTPQRLSQRDVYAAVLYEINQRNLKRSGDDQLPVPSERTVNRVLAGFDPYEVECARHGKRAADDKFRIVGKGPQANWPLDIVEIDHTRADNYVVVDEANEILGRPTITMAFDRRTRMCVGFHVSYSEGGKDVAACLYNIILDKSYVKRMYPEIKSDWPCYGIPRLLVADQALQFSSMNVQDIARQFDISIQICASMSPWLKGVIERGLGTVNQFCHKIPGTTFSNIAERGDYDPKKHVAIRHADLVRLLHKFIIDCYNQEYHEGLRGVPVKVWNEETQRYPVRMPNSRDELVSLLGGYTEPTLNTKGIRFHNLFYKSPEVERLLRQPGRSSNKVKVRFNPDDIHQIWVLDEVAKAYVAIPSPDPAYTIDLPLYSHLILERERDAKALAGYSVQDRAQARHELMENIERYAADARHRKRVLNRYAKATRVAGAPLGGVIPGQWEVGDDDLNDLGIDAGPPEPLPAAVISQPELRSKPQPAEKDGRVRPKAKVLELVSGRRPSGFKVGRFGEWCDDMGEEDATDE